MSINATIDGILYSGIQTILTGGKTIALAETGGSGINVLTGEATIEASSTRMITHNLDLSSYIAIWYLKNWQAYLQSTTSTLLTPVFGISTYNVEINTIPSALLGTTSNRVNATVYIPYKQSDGTWGGATALADSGGYKSTNNAFHFGSNYGNAVGDYVYTILDFSS